MAQNEMIKERFPGLGHTNRRPRVWEDLSLQLDPPSVAFLETL
jgi:hypothetical protein